MTDKEVLSSAQTFAIKYADEQVASDFNNNR